MPTTTQTGTVTLNAAFLQEVKELNVELHQRINRLYRVLSRPRMVRCRTRAITKLLNQLRDDLAMHFAVEEALGYFEDPLEAAPWLCEKAMSLRAEHATLYLEISRLAEDAEALARKQRVDTYADQVPIRFVAFFDRLQAHDRNETELIMDSLYQDVGVGD